MSIVVVIYKINFVKTKLFFRFAHVGAILNAIGGVALAPAVVLLSSTWFPPYQRTLATGLKKKYSYQYWNLVILIFILITDCLNFQGMGTASSLLGMAGSYLVGPWLISEPPQKVNSDDEIKNLRENIRRELFKLMLSCKLK
jgi:hypothetical protein